MKYVFYDACNVRLGEWMCAVSNAGKRKLQLILSGFLFYISINSFLFII